MDSTITTNINENASTITNGKSDLQTIEITLTDSQLTDGILECMLAKKGPCQTVSGALNYECTDVFRKHVSWSVIKHTHSIIFH